MYEYITGQLTELTASYAVVEANGLGYFINISLQCYSSLKAGETVKLFLHQVIREDAHTLFGFSEKGEREMFRLLLSVNGVGSTTAMLMLSAMGHDEIRQAILGENVALLKSAKGIGAKTAQRIILDLKDKVGKASGGESMPLNTAPDSRLDEATMALVMLGFTKKSVEKSLEKIIRANPASSVEDLVKQALKDL